MKKTCGIFLIDSQNKILVVHPTNHAEDLWSIPKGQKDEGEDDFETAIREFKEETNVDLNQLFKEYPLKNKVGEFKYRSGKKTLVAFLIKSNEALSEMNLDLRCTSLITDSELMECDKVEWKDFYFCLDNLHITQQQALGVVLTKYFNFFF